MGELYSNSHRNDITKDSACVAAWTDEDAEVTLAILYRMRDKSAMQKENVRVVSLEEDLKLPQ